jgi:hypothetical protein
MKEVISTKKLVQNLIQKPNEEHEYRTCVTGILFSTRWLIYDSKTQKIGESYNWFHYDDWYSIPEFLEVYSYRKWVRDR